MYECEVRFFTRQSRLKSLLKLSDGQAKVFPEGPGLSQDRRLLPVPEVG